MAVPIPTPEEFNKKSGLSWAAVIYACVLAFFVGFGVCAFMFALAEVDGVRKDMNTADGVLARDIEAVNKRIDRKIENHNQNKNAHK